MALRRKIARLHQNQGHSLRKLYLRGVDARLNLLQGNPVEQVCHKIRHDPAAYHIHVLFFQNQICRNLRDERQDAITKRIERSFSLNHEYVTIQFALENNPIGKIKQMIVDTMTKERPVSAFFTML